MIDKQRRFGGINRLYGPHSVDNLSKAHICIIGVGGVGSWASEALARSGVGKLTLIDMDHVAESNINRQLQALDSTLGKNKVEVLAQRIEDINPECEVLEIDEFLTTDNLKELLHDNLDGIIDCIDDFRTKAALINHCRQAGIELVTTGGAGGKTDPTRIKVTDLARSEQDPLLAKTRSLLRQQYGFPRNLKKKFKVACVWSDEQQVFLWDDGQLRHQRPATCANQSLNCGGLGSSMPITATFGNAAAAYMLKNLTHTDLSNKITN